MTACRLDAHEQWVLDHAEHFTAVAFRGYPHGFDKVQCASRSDAIKAATDLITDRPSLVYAVSGASQAATDIIRKGNIMILLTYKGDYKELTVHNVETAELAATISEALPNDYTAYLFASADELAKELTAKPMNIIHNLLDPSQVVAYTNRAQAANKLWAKMLETATKQAEPPVAEAAPPTGRKPRSDKGKKRGEPVAKTPAEPKGPRALKTDGMVYRVKEHVLAYPSITNEEILAKLTEEGVVASPSSIATFRQDFVHSLRFLKAHGYDIPGINA